MAAPVWVSYAETQGTTTTISASVPASTASGDVLIAYVTVDAIVTITEPGTWTEIITGGGAATADEWTGFYYRVLTGSASAETWTISAARDWSVDIIRITGADTTSPIDVSAAVASAATTTPAVPQVTTTVDDCLVITSISNDQSGSSDLAYTPPSGWTEQFEGFHSGAALNWAIATVTQATAGTVTAATWTTSASDKAALLTIAVKPGSSGGTAHTVGVTDSTGLTDSATRTWTHQPVFTDVVGLTESIHKERGHTKTDPVALSDTFGFQYPRNPGDTMGLTDEITIQLSKGITVTDPVAMTDSVAFGYGKGVIDSVTMTDEIHIKHDVHIVVEESAGLTEDIVAGIPSLNTYTDNVGLSDSATVQLILDTLKPDSLSIVDDRRLVVQEFFSMTDDEVRVMTIGDLAYKYWSFLSQLTPVERESLYDHFKRYAPDGKHWIEDITEQP